MSQDDLTRKNARMGLIVLTVIVGMLALSFASVPLYRLFCQVTGFGGTPNIDPTAVAEKILDQEMTIRFNADVSSNMPWIFEAEQASVTMPIGQKALISFYAKNPTSTTMEGTAIFNVLPENAARYFHKVQCFCFGLQELGPGAEAHMPVAFFIDPKIVDDPDLEGIKTITLSYTFFKADSPELEKAMDSLYQ